MLMNVDRANLFQSLETSGVPSEALARLGAMGITTLVVLRDHWAYGNRQLIVEYLDEYPVRMVSAAPARMLATRGGERLRELARCREDSAVDQARARSARLGGGTGERNGGSRSDPDGGGAFLIRNSWGTACAKPSGRFSPGYGTLFFEYIQKYAIEAFA